jgi:hypothetical protein
MLKLTTCKHFTGIQHDTCAAGVEYEAVKDPARSGLARWPCLRNPALHCPKREFPTQAEVDVSEAETEAAIAKLLADIAAGKCHVCGADAEPSQVVGRCRYAACGHRIGQVNDEEHP